MKKVSSIKKLSFFLLLFSPVLAAADLSIYRGFQFGMSLNAAVKHSGMDPSEVKTTHERPARIQELTWSPVRFSLSDTDPVAKVLLTFYNGQLSHMIVDYDVTKTKGLTWEDIIGAVSAKYGPPTQPTGSFVLPSRFSVEPMDVVARWEDADYSCDLVVNAYDSALELVMFSKRLNALADAAVAEGAQLNTQEAPERLRQQEQNAASDLDKNRVVNKANFRP
jgi:hypothetical protein